MYGRTSVGSFFILAPSPPQAIDLERARSRKDRRAPGLFLYRRKYLPCRGLKTWLDALVNLIEKCGGGGISRRASFGNWWEPLKQGPCGSIPRPPH